MNKLKFEWGIVLGADPEFFLKPKDKKNIIGSEKVIDIKKGVPVDSLYSTSFKSAIICDGVQAELTITPAACRAHVGNQIQECFKKLNKHLKKTDIVPCFKPTINVTKKEMFSLSQASKIFGCSPSKNAWNNPPKVNIADINPEEYRFRSAGGHIHIGQINNVSMRTFLHDNVEDIIQLLDYLLGNTCVLLDRDKNQAKRRKTYGRAGEYRIQPWGIEYRTLSNFWLRSYQLMSFVMGLAREVVLLVKGNYHEEFFKLVPNKTIIKAINTNNFDLAMANFNKLMPLLSTIVPETDGKYPLAKDNLDDFLYVVKKGIDHFFTKDPFDHWLCKEEGHGIGWESFIQKEVNPKRLNKEYKQVYK